MNPDSEPPFENKFREMIVEDTSNWRARPAFDRDKRDEFKMSQLTAMKILDFLQNTLNISRESFGESIGLSLDELNFRIKDEKNFSSDEITLVTSVINS